MSGPCPPRGTAPSPDSGMPSQPKPRILVVEDDADARTILRLQLQHVFDVILARDGKEGVRMAIFHRPDLILMDLMMPDMDGVQATEVIRSIKALHARPIVAYTAAPESLQRKARQHGCDLVIEKPATDLGERLLAFLEGRDA